MPGFARFAAHGVTTGALSRPIGASRALALIGSSLGGYYATWVAERLGCRAVLLNPAIDPARDLQAHIGRQSVFFSDDEIDFRPEYIDELRALEYRCDEA